VVKVLDFGLATIAAEADGAADGSRVTAKGTILGTTAYMSPEQARGRSVGKRSDIWAFGCLLYEMLTGRPAFDGATVSDTIAAILEREPDWAACRLLCRRHSSDYCSAASKRTWTDASVISVMPE
jgi:serine/threonine protein kinase